MTSTMAFNQVAQNISACFDGDPDRLDHLQAQQGVHANKFLGAADHQKLQYGFGLGWTHPAVHAARQVQGPNPLMDDIPTLLAHGFLTAPFGPGRVWVGMVALGYLEGPPPRHEHGGIHGEKVRNILRRLFFERGGE